ncbi:hypothetical protein F6R97_27275 [Pseudomonas sp. JV414]|uniref:hypothetical protein n=1 Tax=Pseudomonas sp. JV414 TaxID=1733110 RepID=UPI0028E0C985|nr:hypothetical protein [Pseudomonas sp. JV414]MDT9678218.1 hypothetical protein [Pseudomonas sp. JV414]
MSNFIVVHKPSQLIQKVITSPTPPALDTDHSFHEASIIILNHFYKLHKKALLKGVQVSVGELMGSCTSFREQISGNKQNKIQLVTTRTRKELTATPVDREATIRDWITSNPNAGVHDLSDQFLTGTVVAKAYLNKYRQHLL